MLKVIARTVGVHQLVLLNFYPFLQKYIKAQQCDVTNLLAAAVQACHDLVPPDVVEPLFRQIVDQFVHDRSRTEAIAVGLNVVKEILPSNAFDDELNTSNDEDGLPQSTLDSGDNIEALCESKENNGNAEDAEEGEAAVSDEEEDDEDADKLMDHTGIISDGYNNDGDMDDDDADRDVDDDADRDAELACASISTNSSPCTLFDEMPIRDLVYWNSMIDGYASLGEMDTARELFEAMLKRNVISWSILIDNYVRFGEPREALRLFQQIFSEGMKPDKVTAVGVITECGQLGALDQGHWVHSFLKKNKIMCDVVVQTMLVVMYMKIVPKVEHYGCVVDLLSRAGRLHEARDIIESMPMKPTSTMWGSFLVACRTHQSVDLAELLVKRLAELGADDSVVSVLMSNIYADEGM
ncbi:hypothetical protein J5N97_000748 [Dioscorea zingiberensis]|uniref:SDA1 N-terminal domain-containing protein n=1 Tax=Dioscorea zingiberensis TaxID=325984 RepID=A0A9D5H2R3_9LILI|nr:hypothetical protein J5N97_000748 [Dioscorea zingiberensis]